MLKDFVAVATETLKKMICHISPFSCLIIEKLDEFLTRRTSAVFGLGNDIAAVIFVTGSFYTNKDTDGCPTLWRGMGESEFYKYFESLMVFPHKISEYFN